MTHDGTQYMKKRKDETSVILDKWKILHPTVYFDHCNYQR
ncbi:MAG: hypothetical protein ACI8RD_001005 [Bacillariaceae sp.]|jgi:hypothetical protein